MIVVVLIGGHAYWNAPSPQQLHRMLSQALPQARALEARVDLFQRAFSGALQKEDEELKGEVRAARDARKKLDMQLANVSHQLDTLEVQDRDRGEELRAVRQEE